MQYHLGVVQRMSTTDPPLFVRRDLWIPLPYHREDIISGRADAVRLTPALRGLFGTTSDNECVYYGWPVLVVNDRTGRLRVVPLFMTQLIGPGSPADQTAVAGEDDPCINSRLLSEEFFPADAVAEATAQASGGVPFGDVRALRARASSVLEALGLDGAEVDPDALRPHLGPVAGVHNCAIAFRGPEALATKGLIEELIELQSRGDWRSTAARFLVEPPLAGTGPSTATDLPVPVESPTSGQPATAPPFSVVGLSLNDSQESAAAAATADPLTVVTGPPGTGKSQLVAAIVANQWLRGETVLVASTNNGAVDVAASRCAGVDPALLVRTGNRAQRDRLPPFLRELASRTDAPGLPPALIRRQLEVASAEREGLHHRLRDRAAKEAMLANLLIELEGLRRLLWGDAGPSPVAQNREKIHRLALAAARTRWLRNRRRRRLVALARPGRPDVNADDVAAWATAEHQVEILTTELTRLGPADPDRDREEVRSAEQAWAEAGAAALQDTVGRALLAGGPALRQLAGMRVGARAARCAATARALPYARGWACTALSVRSNFPLQAGIFDLLVLDEASQCSIADVLPLAYRARRIVVVGDPNQLTPVMTMGRSELDAIARGSGTATQILKHHALDAGGHSAFTAFAARSASVHLLDEHYRCHPAIARYVNEAFYAGALRILTDVAAQSGSIRGLSLVDVDGSTERGATGGALNRPEAEAVVRWVLGHLDEPGSIGVVTPFAAQAALIARLLEQSVDAETRATKRLVVGTAHRFQGDERDVMLFSTVLSADARLGTARWLEEQRNLVNVAVSRARRALVVFADRKRLADLPVPTLHALVAVASGERAGVAPEELVRDVSALHSEAERRLFAALARRGHVPRLKPVVEGYELDFALETGGQPLDVEVDGVHHTDTRGRLRRQDLARDRVLERLGWRVLRVPAWRCLASAEEVSQEVEAAVTRAAAGMSPESS